VRSGTGAAGFAAEQQSAERRGKLLHVVHCGTQLKLAVDCRFDAIASKKSASTRVGTVSSSARCRSGLAAGGVLVAMTKQDCRVSSNPLEDGD
jgi:hypothetical protein